MGAVRVLRGSSLVLALAFLVHAVNGLVVERAALGLQTFNDYARVEALQGAIGSLQWRASGLGHLISAFAVLALALGLAERMRATGFAAAPLAAGLGTVAAAGYGINGIANGLGVQVLRLLQEQNPGLPGGVGVVAFSLLVPMVNGLAIVMTGALLIVVAEWGRRTGSLGRGLVVLGWIAGISGLVMAFAYVPAYLFLYLVWFAWFAATAREA